jgi:hypothetical protein
MDQIGAAIRFISARISSAMILGHSIGAWCRTFGNIDSVRSASPAAFAPTLLLRHCDRSGKILLADDHVGRHAHGRLVMPKVRVPQKLACGRAAVDIQECITDPTCRLGFR